MRILTAIINHNHNEQALHHKNEFGKFCKSIAIDSGSELTETEKNEFDSVNPNIYYSGLINKVCDYAAVSKEDILLIVTSDVTFSNYKLLIDRIKKAFQNQKIGVYAPSVQSSPHKHMMNMGRRGLRQVTFVEGFCFAVRRNIIEQYYPIDTKINLLGWGIDVMTGFQALKQGKISVVDYDVRVFHPITTGYNVTMAKLQRNDWFCTFDPITGKFRKWVYYPFANTSIGLKLMERLIRKN